MNNEANLKQNLEEFMNNIINEEKTNSLTEEEFNKYCELYKEKFGKTAYIAEPNGTREQTINAIKICLEKNEDLLDKLLYPNFDKDMNDKVLY